MDKNTLCLFNIYLHIGIIDSFNRYKFNINNFICFKFFMQPRL